MSETLTSLFSIYGLSGLALALALGQFGIPLPTSILLMSVGALANNGDVGIVEAVLWGICGAVAGDQLGYLVGRLGREYLESVRDKHRWLAAGMARGFEYNDRWGGYSVFFSRWLVSPLGPWINLTSGVSGYRWPLFALWDVIGELIWVCGYVAIGYSFSASIAGIADIIANAGWGIAALAVTVAIGWQLWRRVRAAAKSQAAPPSAVTQRQSAP